METKYENLEVQDKGESTVEITGSVSWENLEPYFEKQLEKLSQEVEIDGFRKGNAPRDAVIKELGEMHILQHAAQDVLGDVYPAVVTEKNLAIIGYPQVNITKLAHGSSMEFSLTTAVMPEVKLADYKAIAQEKNKEEIEAEVSDEEFQETVDRMRKMYAHSAEGAEDTGKGDPDSEHDLPELTDEFVQKIGDYKDVDDFKTKFRDELLERKKSDERSKRREEIITAIAEQSTFELPQVLIESEKDKMLAQIKDDIARMGLEYSAWLEHSGKTEGEMRDEMHDDATGRAGADVIIKQIAKEEQLSPDQEQVNTQVSAIAEVHKDVPEEQIRAYVENIYLNEAVLKFLEEQK